MAAASDPLHGADAKTSEGDMETSIRRYLLVLLSQIVIKGSLHLHRRH